MTNQTATKTKVLAEYFGVDEAFLNDVLREIKATVVSTDYIKYLKDTAHPGIIRLMKEAAASLNKGLVILNDGEMPPVVEKEEVKEKEEEKTAHIGKTEEARIARKERMAKRAELQKLIPRTHDMIEPIFLEIYGKEGNVFRHYTEIIAALEKTLKIDPSHVEYKDTEGRPILFSHVSWAMTYLRKAGLIAKVQEPGHVGCCRKTAAGNTAYKAWQEKPYSIDVEFLKTFPGTEKYFGKKARTEPKPETKEVKGVKVYKVRNLIITHDKMLEAASLWHNNEKRDKIAETLGCDVLNVYNIIAKYREFFPKRHQ